MTLALSLTFLHLLCIAVCTDAMRWSWDAQRGGPFLLGLLGVSLNMFAVMFRMFTLLSQ